MEASKFSLIASKFVGRLFGEGINYRLKYFHNRKHFPNFNHPKDITEYMLSTMLNPAFDQYAKYADKVKVREYIKECGLDHILLKHYGVWERPEDIEWEKLPNKFILKANNGCGNHCICKDISMWGGVEKQKAIDTLNKSILNGLKSAERHYNVIKPMVFAEELIDTGSDKLPADYKIMCINGNPDHFFVACEREKSARYDTYDFEWNRIPYTKKKFFPNIQVERPQHIAELVEYAKRLSYIFPVVRVDFYEFEGKIYFSELTFSPWGGFLYSYTDEAILEMGKKLGLK